MHDKHTSTFKHYKILVVTNDDSFIKKLNSLFDYSYHFIQALPSDSLIKKACDIQPDLILKDISQNKKDSIHILKSKRSDQRISQIPIILFTENINHANLEEYYNIGVSDYLTTKHHEFEIISKINTQLELKRKTEENKEMRLVKNKFFAIMTKDIKDSLIGVKGIAKFLVQDLERNDGDKTDEVIKMARILLEDSEELYNFLENLIQWASIETDKTQIEPGRFKLYYILASIIDNFQKEIFHKNININYNYDKKIELQTDKNALNIVLFHIISNAVKYSNKNGEITINAKKINNESITQIEIKDFGVGMDQDVVDHIFKLDTPHPKTIGTNSEKGTGLGLIICRSIIDKLLGKIEIYSKKHRGTKVTIKIPSLNNNERDGER